MDRFREPLTVGGTVDRERWRGEDGRYEREVRRGQEVRGNVAELMHRLEVARCDMLEPDPGVSARAAGRAGMLRTALRLVHGVKRP